MENLALFEEESPFLASEAPSLRWYQEEAVSAIEDAWVFDDAALVVMATGLGKTQVFSAVAGMSTGRVLVLCHRSELVDQAAKRLEQVTGEAIGIEQGQWRSGRERIVVGSVQTVYRERRLERLRRNGGFAMVIVDEAHHYVSRTYRKAVEAWPGAKILGVTATPDRGDKKALGQLFTTVAYTMDIVDGIEAGYLAPLVGRREELDDFDISGVDSVAGDLVAAQLDAEVLKVTEGVVQVTLEKYGDRPGVLFFPGVKSAEFAAERFNLARPGCAVMISGDTDPDLRKRMVQDLHAGRVQYLCNCMIATEGFDWPAASVIVIARPTKSRSLYAQMAGRGTRPWPGVVDRFRGREGAADRVSAIAASPKPDCILVDLVGNSGRHSLVGPEDILGGRYGEDEIKEAKKRAEMDGGGDPMKHLREAQAALKALAAKAKAKVTSRSEVFDPFSLFGGEPLEIGLGGAPASPGQVAALTKMGVPGANELSKREAGRMLTLATVRRKSGLATYKQMKILRKFGIIKTNVTMKQASAAIDYIADHHWGKSRIDPDRLRSLTDG